tara:strand:- start:85 stop:411 length:327 start_codon:yes stop_codon:yes gene_type:complete
MPKGSWMEFDKDQIKPISENSSTNLRNFKNDPVRVQKTKVGRGGKIVTLVNGLDVTSLEVKALFKRMKTICGTGGTIKNESLELQGDHVEEILDLLRAAGYRPKRSGG